MTRILSLLSPAKINLFLRVTGRRSNGYHELDSLFLPITLYDRITIELRPSHHPSVKVTSNVGGLPVDQNNLAYRAARAVLDCFGVKSDIVIHIEKEIPLGSGMGGGSSNGAFVLMALANEFKLENKTELEKIALNLGADVPFFLHTKAARVRGIGERITVLPKFPPLNLVLAMPAVEVSTAMVFGELKPWEWSGPTPDEEIDRLCRGELIAALIKNDLLNPALRLYPQIGRALHAVKSTGPLAWGMTGSGGTVFGLYSSMQEAERARQEISQKYPELWSRTATTLDRSDLQQLVCEKG